MEPAEAPSSPRLSEDKIRRHRSAVIKPEFDDYVCLNFVDSEKNRTELTPINNDGLRKREMTGMQRKAEERGNIGNVFGEGHGGRSSDEEAERTWRSSVVRNCGRPAVKSPDMLHRNGREGPVPPDAGDDSVSDVDHELPDRGTLLHPRSLGPCVSVLDEMDAVARSRGVSFAGEDPMRGRLGAADQFQRIGCLQDGAAAITSLVDQAESTLRALTSSATSSINGSGSTASESGNSYDLLTFLCDGTNNNALSSVWLLQDIRRSNQCSKTERTLVSDTHCTYLPLVVRPNVAPHPTPPECARLHCRHVHGNRSDQSQCNASALTSMYTGTGFDSGSDQSVGNDRVPLYGRKESNEAAAFSLPSGGSRDASPRVPSTVGPGKRAAVADDGVEMDQYCPRAAVGGVLIEEEEEGTAEKEDAFDQEEVGQISTGS